MPELASATENVDHAMEFQAVQVGSNTGGIGTGPVRTGGGAKTGATGCGSLTGVTRRRSGAQLPHVRLEPDARGGEGGGVCG